MIMLCGLGGMVALIALGSLAWDRHRDSSVYGVSGLTYYPLAGVGGLLLIVGGIGALLT